MFRNDKKQKSNKLSVLINIDDILNDPTKGSFIINRINNLHNKGFKIILMTSRGMESGNKKKAEKYNRNELELELSRYQINYDELIFGLPVADIYILNNCTSLNDFSDNVEQFRELSLDSTYPIYKIGGIVKKTSDNKTIESINNWYDESKNIVKSPRIISIDENFIKMEYIKGRSLFYYLSKSKSELSLLFKRLIDDINSFSRIKINSEFDVEYFINKLETCKDKSDMLINDINISISLIKKHALRLKKSASLCHGNLLFQNIQVNEKGELYYLDPAYDPGAATYLMDFAATRISLNNFEFHFRQENNRISDIYMNYFDDLLKTNKIFDLVYILQYIKMIFMAVEANEKDKTIITAAVKNMSAQDKLGILVV